MIRLIIICVFCFFSAIVFAGEADVLSILIPDKLKTFVLKKSSRAGVQKIWGKPDLVEGSRDYYIQEGIKYPVEFSYDKKDLLKKIYYRFITENPPRYEQLKTILDTKPLEDASKNLEHKGEYFLVRLPDAHIVLKFRNDKNKTLDTLVME